MVNVAGWFKAKVADPFWSYIKQSAHPSILARSAAIGFSIGVCPLVGVSTGITLLTILVARCLLHGPMTLLANFVALPADIALLLPFMRCGEFILRAPQLPLTRVSIKDIFLHHQGEVLRALGHAMLGWAVCFPIMVMALMAVLQPIFGCLQRRMQKRSSDNNLNEGDTRTRLLDEDAASTCSADERQLRRSASLSPGPPMRERTPRWQHAADGEGSIL